jgi:hypothetical protein
MTGSDPNQITDQLHGKWKKACCTWTVSALDDFADTTSMDNNDSELEVPISESFPPTVQVPSG